MTPNTDVRHGSRIERAAWMRQVNGALYNIVLNACRDCGVDGDTANSISEVVQNYLKEFGRSRTGRTNKKPGGVGRQ